MRVYLVVTTVLAVQVARAEAPAPPPPAPATAVVTGGAAPSCRAAVLDLAPGEGVTVERAAALSEMVVGEVGANLRGCSVVSRSELRALVSFETERKLSGCDSESCLEEIGEALGVDRLVIGTVARVDTRTLVALRLVDLRDLRVLRRVTDSFEGPAGETLTWVGWLARRLVLDDESAAGPRPVADRRLLVERRMSVARTLAWTGVGVGGALLVTSAGLGVASWSLSGALPALKTARGADREQIEGIEATGPWLAGGANLALYTGAALVLIGGGLFLVPGDETVELERP